MEKIVIFGTGKMAHEIANECLQYGYSVLMFTKRLDYKLLHNCKDNIDIRYYKDNLSMLDEDFSEVRYIIEASYEDFEKKKEIIQYLNNVITSKHIIILNTLAQSLTKLASYAKYPQNVLGIQFFSNVAEQIKVGVISTSYTDEKSVLATKMLVSSLNKESVIMMDTPGGIVARVVIPFIIEAIRILEEGDQTVESIDKIVVLGMNLKKGPLQLADEIGLDIIKLCLEQLYEETKLGKYRPCKLLNDMVCSGYLGCKTKRGFYQY